MNKYEEMKDIGFPFPWTWSTSLLALLFSFFSLFFSSSEFFVAQGGSQIDYVTENGLELVIFLPHLPSSVISSVLPCLLLFGAKYCTQGLMHGGTNWATSPALYPSVFMMFMSLSVSICACVCMCECISMWYIYVCVYMLVCLCVYMYMFVHMCVYLCVFYVYVLICICVYALHSYLHILQHDYTSLVSRLLSSHGFYIPSYFNRVTFSDQSSLVNKHTVDFLHWPHRPASRGFPRSLVPVTRRSFEHNDLQDLRERCNED